LRKSKNILVKGAGYAGGLATAIGRGLASPVTFADPRLSGKQRSGQVGDGILSYIPVGKILGLGGKALKPIGRQLAGRFPGLVSRGTKLVAGSRNVIKKVASTKPVRTINNTIQRSRNSAGRVKNHLTTNVIPKTVRGVKSSVRNNLAKLRSLPERILSGVRNKGVVKTNSGFKVYNSAGSGEVFTSNAILNAKKLYKKYGDNLQRVKIIDPAKQSGNARVNRAGRTPQIFDSKGLTSEAKKVLNKELKYKRLNSTGNRKVINNAEANSGRYKLISNNSKRPTKKADFYTWQNAHTLKDGTVVKAGYVPVVKGQKLAMGHKKPAAQLFNDSIGNSTLTKSSRPGGLKYDNPTAQRKMRDLNNYEIQNGSANSSMGSRSAVGGKNVKNIPVKVSEAHSRLPKDYYKQRREAKEHLRQARLQAEQFMRDLRNTYGR
jgi:hypothetical protein